MKFGLVIGQSGISWAELKARAEMAQLLGFDAVWTSDHLIDSESGDCVGFEAMTMLSGLAASVANLRVGTLVANVTLRSSPLLIRQMSTIGQIASGRLSIGLGIGWDAREATLLDLQFPPPTQRYEQLIEVLRILRPTGGYTEAGLEASNIDYTPEPTLSRVPIWVGGGGPRRTLAVAAWFADTWHCYGEPEVLARKNARLNELALLAGRKPADIGRASSICLNGSKSIVMSRISRLEEAGCDYLVCQWPRNGDDGVRSFADQAFEKFQSRTTARFRMQ